MYFLGYHGSALAKFTSFLLQTSNNVRSKNIAIVYEALYLEEKQGIIIQISDELSMRPSPYVTYHELNLIGLIV